jgi:hypothetical protein
LKKLTGLLVFVLALAGAIALTRYYSARRPVPPAPAPAPALPAPPVPPDVPGSPGGPGAPSPNAAVSFKVRNAVLDFDTGKSHLTLDLEHDPARPAPEKLWVWAFFFSPDSGGGYAVCESGPVEVSQPFANGGRVTTATTAPAEGCARPGTPTTNYYVRVNVSAESAFAARLSERRISYDINSAAPVVVQGARNGRR